MSTEAKVIFFSIISFILAILLFMSFQIIPTSYVGIKSRFGVITSQTPLEPGFHFKLPKIDLNINLENIRLEEKKLSINATKADSIANFNEDLNKKYSVQK